MAARVGTRSAFICPVSDQCCVHEASILRVGTHLCCAGDELSAVSFMAAREFMNSLMPPAARSKRAKRLAAFHGRNASFVRLPHAKRVSGFQRRECHCPEGGLSLADSATR